MRKIFTLLLSLVLLPLVAWGQEITGYWTDEGVREEMTPENGTVYKISTPGQLGWISWKINEGGGLGSNYEIVLADDIDLNGHYWIPISIDQNFKGNNYTISNITITAKDDNTDMGFFEKIEDCDVSDLTLENVTVNPEKRKSYRFGALVAYLNSGNIKNCYVKNATIHVSYNNVTYVGGLVGNCQGADMDNCSVEEVTVLIEEFENNGYYSICAGGLAGRIYMGSPYDVSAIRNCSAAGTIKGKESTWTETALKSFMFGGLIGNFYAYLPDGPNNNTIENSQSSFNVELNTIPIQTVGEDHTQIVGGLCGSIEGYGQPFIELSNCVYNGEITAPGEGVDYQIGYLFGVVESTVEATAKVENCFYPSGKTPVGGDGTYSSGITEISDNTVDALNQWVENNSTEENEFRTWNTDEDGNVVLAGEEPQPAEGTDYVWDGDICTLLTPKGLLWFANQVNNNETFTGKTITLAERDWDMTSANWTPIGNEDNSAFFSGTFDGNNQTVKIKGSEGGFFGYVKEGTIQNLTVDGTLTEVNTAGVVIDLIENGIVENVIAEGSITNTTATWSNSIGGVIGKSNSSTIMNCSNESNITITFSEDSHAHGGIVGVGCDDQISGCVNNGTIKSSAYWVGGIIGLLDIKNNGGTSVISDCINNGSITGASKTGGIVGCTEGYDDNITSGEVKIINSVNNGTIQATSYVGGIVGIADGSRTYFKNSAKINNSIINCLNTGTVTGTSYVSGIGTVQAHEAMNTNIEFCINQGVITGSGTPTAIFAVYSKKDGTVTIKDSYYQAQSGLEATAVDQEGGNFTIESLQEIPTNKEWLADLNESISAYNTAHPDELKALYWVFDANDKLTFGIPAPTIEGDTPFEESTEITINVLAGTTVYYTTDGMEPTTSSTEYSAPFEITETTTVKAIAVMGEDMSTISEATFKTVPKAPVISTESTTFDESITVTITAEEDAAIYYTIDGQAVSYITNH